MSSPYLTGGRINLPYLNLFSIIGGTTGEAVAELSDMLAIVCGHAACWVTVHVEPSSSSSYQCEMFAGICSYDFQMASASSKNCSIGFFEWFMIVV